MSVLRYTYKIFDNNLDCITSNGSDDRGIGKDLERNGRD